MAARDAWWERGTCLVEGHPPSTFYPEGRGRQKTVKAHEAVLVCRRCPVSRLCFEDSAAAGNEHGVAGGYDWTPPGRTSEAGQLIRDEQLAVMRELWARGVGMDGFAQVIPFPVRGAA